LIQSPTFIFNHYYSTMKIRTTIYRKALVFASMWMMGIFAIAQSCPATFTVPYLENFDAVSTCGTSCGTVCTTPSSVSWTNNTTDDGDWLVDANGTSSSNTGPSGDHTSGSGNYLYTEASGCSGDSKILTSPCFDVSGAVCPAMRVWYHMFGATMGSFDVEVSFDLGVTWTSRFSRSGNQGNQWNEAVVDLSGSSTTVRVRFVGVVGSSFTSDMAIDDAEVFDANGSTFVASFSGLPATTTVTSLPSTLVPTQGGGTFSGPGVSGATFDPSVAGVGVHLVTYTNGPGSCAASTTQTVLVTGATCPSPLRVSPWVDDFESQSTCTGSCTSTCTLIDQWTNDASDGTDWIVDVGGTSSGSTGPSTDFNPGSSTGKYLYLESSGCTNQDANLISPCVLVAGGTCPVLTWGYHMFGTSQGTMNVYISTNAGTSWTNVFTVSGNQGNQWLRGVVDLSGYVGQTVRFRFEGLIGSSFTSDMAIDDVQVIDFSTSSSNFDIVSGSNINPASISIFDPPAQLVAATPGGTYSSIPPTPALSGNTFDPAAAGPGVYIINYNVGPPSCNLSFTRVLIVTNLSCNSANTVTTYPYVEDFDGFSTCTGSCGAACPLTNNWINDPTDDMDWTVDANGTSSGSTGPSGDHTSGNGNYLYTETSGAACNNATADLISPCFNLAGLSCPFGEFWYHQYGAAQGRLEVSVSIDGGLSWLAAAFSSTGDQGNQWNQVLVDLSTFAGATIRFRIRGLTGTGFTSDMAVDDFSLVDLSAADPSFAGLPASSCTSSGPITLVPATLGGSFTSVPATAGLSGFTFDPAVAGAGTYTLTYQTPGPATCFQVSQPQSITVLPPPTVTASNDVTICEGSSTTLSASSSNCPNPGQVFFTASTPVQLLTSTGQNMNFSFAGPFPAASGDVTVTVHARGDYGFGTTETIDLVGEGNTFLGNTGNLGECSPTFQTADLVIPVALFNLWIQDNSLDLLVDNLSGVNTFCTDTDVFLSLSYPAGGCGLLWSTGDVASSITVSPLTTETYYVTVIDSGGCEATDSVTVNVIPSPIADAGDDQEICFGESADLGVFAAPGGGSVTPGNNSLTTTFAGGNGAGGNMFDIVAGGSPVTITGFDGNWSSASADIEIFYKTGTHIGFETNSGAWTSLGTANGVVTNGSGNATPIPIPISVVIPSGATAAFYIHSNSGSISYSNGSSQGAVYVSDGAISILEGVGKSSGTPFGLSTFNPRMWNGNVYYNLPGQGSSTNPVSILWSTGATTDSITVSPAVSTDYYVTVTDSFGCSSMDTVSVTVNPLPELSAAVTPVSCFGGNDGAVDLSIAGDSLPSGPGTLTTTFAGGNGQSGNMFDIVATTNLTITSFDIHIGATSTQTVEIYTKTGSHVGFETNASAWTLLATTTVTGAGIGNPTALPANLVNVPIAAGNTQSFYVTLSTSTSIDYSNGTAVGNVLASNADLTVLEGVGKAYPFGGTFSTRNWNGTVRYLAGSVYDILWTGPGSFSSTDEDISNLIAGNYTVTVTDGNDCSSTLTATVSEPTLLVAEAGPNATVYLGYPAAECTTLSGSQTGGTPGYTVEWTDDSNASISTMGNVQVCPTVSTTYYYTVNDANGCVATDSMRVCVIDVRCTVGGNNGNGNGGGSSSNNAAGPPRVEICHIPPGNPSNQMTKCLPLPAIASHLAHGDLLGACGTNTNCDFGSSKVASSGQNGISSGLRNLSLDAYPNPTNGLLTIDLTSEGSIARSDCQVQLVDMMGKVLATKFLDLNEDKHSVVFDLSDYAQGIYLIVVKAGDVQLMRNVMKK
jgi:hypothetical protein